METSDLVCAIKLWMIIPSFIAGLKTIFVKSESIKS